MPEPDTQKIMLAGTPPLLTPVFEGLVRAGATHFALFGGAIRDADYSARHGVNRPVKDYDIRIWLPAADIENQTQTLVENLQDAFNTTARLTPSAGTGRIRYCFDFGGSELDISIRPMPDIFDGTTPPVEAVARDRAFDSDIGICAVAIDPSGQVWARPEYLQDQTNKTLSVYPIADTERKSAYTERMRGKFPAHRVVEIA